MNNHIHTVLRLGLNNGSSLFGIKQYNRKTRPKISPRRKLITEMWLPAVYLILIILFHESHQIPIRGNFPWTMFLCKFQDDAFEPRPLSWFESWMNEESLDGSVINYFKQVSNGIYTTYNSKVFGWFSLPFSKQQVMDQAKSDPNLQQYKEDDRKLYFKSKELCVSQGITTFRLNIKPGPNVITVINDEVTALFCKESGVLVTPRFILTAALTHEMVHSLHIGHSFSDQPVKIFPYSAPGEYDDQYDLMSTAHAYMYTSSMGFNGPGLSGPHLDYLGWLPANRIYYFGKDGPMQRLKLGSLSLPHSDTKDWLLIILPYDRNDARLYYTLEYRTKHSLDSGIPRPGVLVHKIVNENGFYYAKLVNQGGPFYDLVENSQWTVLLNHNFGNRFIKIIVEQLDFTGTVTVLVHSTFTATACASGESQRLAYSDDLACVPDAQQRATQDSNAQKSSRQNANGECLSPFVKRQGFVNDDVCVTESERLDFKNQNDRWKRFQNFFQASTYGMNSCLEEMVWRLVDGHDYVCVTKIRRDEILHENELDKQRKASDGRCFQGFVFRNSVPNDNICVTESEMNTARVENQKLFERLVYYKFFNGEDEV